MVGPAEAITRRQDLPKACSLQNPRGQAPGPHPWHPLKGLPCASSFSLLTRSLSSPCRSPDPGLLRPKLLSHAVGPTPPSSASLASAGLRAHSSRAVPRASLTPAWHLPGGAKQHPKMLAGGGDRGVQGGEAEPNRGASGCSGGYSAARSGLVSGATAPTGMHCSR